MRPRLDRRTRVTAALSAVAAAIVVAAVVAGAGSAKDTPTTLHLVGTIQKNIGFAPDHPPRQGDRFGGGSEITGDDSGVQPTKAVEAARALGLAEVCTLALPAHLASQRVLEKAGLRHEQDVEHAGLRHWFGCLALPSESKLGPS